MARSPLDFLEEVREKPEPVRKLIGAVLVVLIMAAIVGIWATNLDLSVSTQPASAAGADLNSPLATLWNFVKDSISQIYK